jgi:hypothetical protein
VILLAGIGEPMTAATEEARGDAFVARKMDGADSCFAFGAAEPDPRAPEAVGLTEDLHSVVVGALVSPFVNGGIEQVELLTARNEVDSSNLPAAHTPADAVAMILSGCHHPRRMKSAMSMVRLSPTVARATLMRNRLRVLRVFLRFRHRQPEFSNWRRIILVRNSMLENSTIRPPRELDGAACGACSSGERCPRTAVRRSSPVS